MNYAPKTDDLELCQDERDISGFFKVVVFNGSTDMHFQNTPQEQTRNQLITKKTTPIKRNYIWIMTSLMSHIYVKLVK